MQVVAVARALSEILKIFGGLGIVNVFSLSLLYKSKINLTGVPDGGTMDIDGISVLSIRPLNEPDVDSIVCGFALIMVFIRFFYGSMILLEGEYVLNENRRSRIRLWDFLPVIFFLPLFSIMSFYAGLGSIVPFSILLLLLLVLDAATMQITKDDATSKYTSERKNWAQINTITVIVILLLASFFIYTQVTHNSAISSVTTLLYASIGIYCIASLFDLIRNRSFYLGSPPVA